MGASRPHRPPFLRLLNGVGGALRAAGVPLVRLDERSLLDSAAKNTGLSDFGDEAFRAPLRILLSSFETEAALTLLGRIIARTDTLRTLVNRLRHVDTLKHHPEILEAPIRQPLFILGLPRTGTTILH